jgi:HPt (histidine-containing phosphotransfer) domain-containing protein
MSDAMMEELYRRFLPRFVEVAGERLRRVSSLERGRNLSGVILELHSLAGEASALGFGPMAAVVRELEGVAASWRDSGDTAAPSAWLPTLELVQSALAEVAAKMTGSESP